MLVSGLVTRRSRQRLRNAEFASNRVVHGFIAFLLIFSVLAALPQRPVSAESAGSVNADVLNLRDDAGTWANIILQMTQDEYVTVLDGPTSDGWYYIDYNGLQGWSYGAYLLVDGSPGWSDDSGVGGYAATAWVATDGLNVRADASTEAWVMDRLDSGAEVTVIGDQVNGFVPIDFYGQRAYVWSEFVSFDGPVATGPERWIDVNRSSQTVTLFEGDEVVGSYWAAMGWDESDDGFYATAVGTYSVYGKHEDLAWTEWGQAYIEYWVGFDASRINGFHSYSMNENGSVLKNGDGPTGGCIALEPSAAALLFDFAGYGTRVEIHW